MSTDKGPKIPQSSRSSSQVSFSAGSLLKRWLSDRTTARSTYSLRLMARALKISPGYLSQILNGKRKLTAERAVDFAQGLKLGRTLTRDLVRAATLDTTTHQSRARKVVESLIVDVKKARVFRSAKEVKFRILREWYHVAILDLSHTLDFVTDADWIAKRLGITAAQAGAAIDDLKSAQMLELRDGKWQKPDAFLSFASGAPRDDIREHHKLMISKAVEALSDDSPEAFENRSITGVTFSATPEKLAEAFELIDEFRNQLASLLSSENDTEVFQLNVQLFKLSRPVETTVKSTGN